MEEILIVVDDDTTSKDIQAMFRLLHYVSKIPVITLPVRIVERDEVEQIAKEMLHERQISAYKLALENVVVPLRPEKEERASQEPFYRNLPKYKKRRNR